MSLDRLARCDDRGRRTNELRAPSFRRVHRQRDRIDHVAAIRDLKWKIHAVAGARSAHRLVRCNAEAVARHDVQLNRHPNGFDTARAEAHVRHSSPASERRRRNAHGQQCRVVRRGLRYDAALASKDSGRTHRDDLIRHVTGLDEIQWCVDANEPVAPRLGLVHDHRLQLAFIARDRPRVATSGGAQHRNRQTVWPCRRRALRQRARGRHRRTHQDERRRFERRPRVDRGHGVLTETVSSTGVP
jgi:hypothetical protein